jgi:hypothetical protein
MQIPEVILSIPEMHEAVGNWLKLHGVDLPVKSVDTQGYPTKGFAVELQTEKEPEAEAVAQ